MTKEQRDILATNVQGGDDGSYNIVGIEYPSHPYNWRASDGTCLKISTEVIDKTRAGIKVRYSDWYSEDGRTVDTQETIV